MCVTTTAAMIYFAPCFSLNPFFRPKQQLPPPPPQNPPRLLTTQERSREIEPLFFRRKLLFFSFIRHHITATKRPVFLAASRFSGCREGVFSLPFLAGLLDAAVDFLHSGEGKIRCALVVFFSPSPLLLSQLDSESLPQHKA